MRTLSIILLLLAPSTLPAQAPAPKPLVVPFELLPSRHVAVQVMVNGKGPYRLVFDTGAPINLLATKAAKEAGVLGTKPGPGAFPLFGMMGGQTIKTLQLGDAKVENISAIVMDHPTVAALAEAFGPLDGIVGFPFFARFAMTVDYQKKELTLVPNGYKPADFLEGMMATMMKASEQKGLPRIAAPAGLWGFAVEKPTGDDTTGVVVSEVFAKSPAAAVGLKKGDRLLTMDGRWTESVADVHLAAGLVKPGREVAIVVKRDGKEMKMKIVPVKGI